ncbi:MAG TPA: hypothetical protein DCL77_05750 [Prolixibacteraceae bacterium]|jgi:hypothetical protein|nr:hypothetical protein [Prolixibacteraceae bacterium]
MKENSAEDFDSLFIKKKSNTGIKTFLILFSLLILGFTGVYTYLNVGAVRDRMKSAQAKTEGATPMSPSLIGLQKEKAWYESRLKMANSDSIGLSIDLENHLLQLELKGVVVLSSKIVDYSTSGFFKRMDGNVYFSMFGTPLTIQKYESSIEKNAFKVVQAPKSVEEAEAAKTKKDSLHHEVFWTVKLDRDFELNIQGIDSVTAAQSKYQLGKGFEFKRDLNNIANSFQHILKFQKPVYTPEILISIPANEAKAILNALPRKALVIIRI